MTGVHFLKKNIEMPLLSRDPFRASMSIALKISSSDTWLSERENNGRTFSFESGTVLTGEILSTIIDGWVAKNSLKVLTIVSESVHKTLLLRIHELDWSFF